MPKENVEAQDRRQVLVGGEERMTIPIEQKQILIGCSTYDEFKNKFVVVFKDKIDPMKLANRVRNIWYRREEYLKDMENYQVLQRTVMIPAVIKKPAIASSLKPDDDMQVKIFNQLLYIGQLIKEQNELFAKLAAQRGD